LFGLGIGKILTFFHIVGNEDVVIAVLKKNVTWGNIKGSKSIINFELILSRPTALGLTCRTLARTSLWFIHIKLKLLSHRGINKLFFNPINRIKGHEHTNIAKLLRS